MDEQEIIYEVRDGVARITLNRPEKLNALSSRMLTLLHDALGRLTTTSRCTASC